MGCVFQYFSLNPSSFRDIVIFIVTIGSILCTLVICIKWRCESICRKEHIEERYEVEQKEIKSTTLPPRYFLPAFYQELGREKDLSMNILHTTTNWALALIGAVLTVYFLYYQSIDKKNLYFSLASLLLILGIIFRLFVRSILAYNNLLKWNDLKEKTLLLIADYENNIFRESFKESYALFISLWRAYRPTKELILSNLHLGYVHIFILVILLVIKNICLLPDRQKLIGVIWFVSLMTFELYSFLNSRYFITPVKRTFEMSKTYKSLKMVRRSEDEGR